MINMGYAVTNNIIWKKGERGIQYFIFYESDGYTKRNVSGKTVKLRIWKDGSTTLKGDHTLTHVDSVNGKLSHAVTATDTDTVEKYRAELVEDPAGTPHHSNTFDIEVIASGTFT